MKSLHSSLRRALLMPASSHASGHQHFDNFCKYKPVEAIPNGHRKRVREDGQPAESTREEHHFSGYCGKRSPTKTPRSMFVNPPGNKRHQRIGHKKSTGWAEQVGNPAAENRRTKYRKTNRTLDQIKRKGSKTSTRTEQ